MSACVPAQAAGGGRPSAEESTSATAILAGTRQGAGALLAQVCSPQPSCASRAHMGLPVQQAQNAVVPNLCIGPSCTGLHTAPGCLTHGWFGLLRQPASLFTTLCVY